MGRWLLEDALERRSSFFAFYFVYCFMYSVVKFRFQWMITIGHTQKKIFLLIFTFFLSWTSSVQIKWKAIKKENVARAHTQQRTEIMDFVFFSFGSKALKIDEWQNKRPTRKWMREKNCDNFVQSFSIVNHCNTYTHRM